MKRLWKPSRRIVVLLLFCLLGSVLDSQCVTAQTPIQTLPTRVRAPSIMDAGPWFNTAGPLSLRQLRGKIVVLDFWTYCCINCLQTLPELKKLEQAYPNEVVVIGVHSPKFLNERDDENLREAIQRYDVEHPVINDANRLLWRKYGVLGWPTLKIIDPEGFLIGTHDGEATFEILDRFISRAVRVYQSQGVLDSSPLHFDLERDKAEKTPLRFPGKVLADEDDQRLFIADTGHNRIIVTKLDGTVLDVIGGGAAGLTDGTYDEALFDHPQGMALRDHSLYVADTENHAIRLIDLNNKEVTTIAGNGTMARRIVVRAGTRPTSVELSSPWDLWIHQDELYIAMAGKHQIWEMSLSGSRIGPLAGNGVEDVIDGPLLPRSPLQGGFAAFAQPSGLTSDGQWLFVADSEGSSVRAVPFQRNQRVQTVIGTSHLPADRLFTFGDRDGPAGRALLQHPLDVAFHEGQLLVADTYNHKIKTIDLAKLNVQTIAGADSGKSDDPPRFSEPSGLSIAGNQLFVADTNNHLIRVVDLSDGYKTRTLAIGGLKPPAAPKPAAVAELPGAKRISFGSTTVSPDDGKLRLGVSLALPDGWKLNEDVPISYTVSDESDSGLIPANALGVSTQIDRPLPEFEIALPLSETAGSARIKMSLVYYYCLEGNAGLCKVGGVVWSGEVSIAEDARLNRVELQHAIR